MRVHVFSRSNWYEPHRIRQQLAMLISTNYLVEYHSPENKKNELDFDLPININLNEFLFIKKFASLPIISLINAIILFFYTKFVVRQGDVVFNFLPELIFIPKIPDVKIYSFINDDFTSMSPKISAWWMKYMMEKMALNARATLYVSTKLISKYKCSKTILFYPWTDVRNFVMPKVTKKNIILYWGYISLAFDFSVLEQMAIQIHQCSLNMKILLVGPVESSVQSIVNRLAKEYSCIAISPPKKNLEDLEIEKVLFGIELISPDFRNASFLELPNKAPRLLSYYIPLVYSGCDLLDEPFFIRYGGSVDNLVNTIENRTVLIKDAIDKYFLKNNSVTRFELLTNLIEF